MRGRIVPARPKLKTTLHLNALLSAGSPRNQRQQKENDPQFGELSQEKIEFRLSFLFNPGLRVSHSRGLAIAERKVNDRIEFPNVVLAFLCDSSKLGNVKR